MATIIKNTVTINKPVETVWDVFMNPANLPHWLTGFVSITTTRGRPGEIGSLNEVVFKERGKEIVFIEKVLQVTPMHHCRFEIEHKTLSSENDFRFISFGHYTEIIQTMQPFPKSMVLRLLMPIIKGSIKKRMTNDLFNLKKLIEENTKG